MNYDNHFKLYPYDEALTHSVVINSNQLDFYMWFEMPHHLAKYLSLFDITEMKSDSESVKIDFVRKVKREHKKPWICAETELFNTKPGYHIYKFSFYDTEMNTTLSLYFSYHIQTDNPDKSSYIYMKREENDNG